jgi:hypothetical protein
MRRNAGLVLTLLCCLAGCGQEHTTVRVVTPATGPIGAAPAPKGHDSGREPTAPVDALSVYVDGFHFYNGDLGSQVEAHHYCSVVDADVRQCVIFDGNGRGAKLMGVEYIVSRRVFERLPPEERKLWHSHAYEVTSGTLVAPGLSAAAEHEFMTSLVGTYGKTWRTWHAGQDDGLPTGHPLLMAGFTEDGQIEPSLVQARDDRLHFSTADRRRARGDIASPDVVDGADAWQRGEVLQLTLQQTVAKTEPPRSKAEPDHDAPPTRRIRSNRVQQMYATVPRVDHD